MSITTTNEVSAAVNVLFQTLALRTAEPLAPYYVGSQPAEGVVADVSGNKVMVTMGEGQVFSGDIIGAVGLGKEIYHPETGVLLSREEEELGRLRVTETRDTFSFAAPVEGTVLDRMKVGDKVVSTREPESYEYAAPWGK